MNRITISFACDILSFYGNRTLLRTIWEGKWLSLIIVDYQTLIRSSTTGVYISRYNNGYAIYDNRVSIHDADTASS